ncbi:hypothetical protein AB0A73_27925 [Glycomyces sp. NPDC047369]
MSPRSAAKTVGAGFAVAALAALAQLGLAYGFGLLSWADAAPGAADPVLDYRWNANLAWVAWFAAASCVVGGLASGAIGSRAAAHATPGTRFAAVFASAAGAFAVGPLVALSAEQGAVSDGFPVDPLVAAGLGAAVGFALALIGLSSRSVAVNVGASAALVWILAVLAVFVDVGDRVSPVTELGVWGSWAGSDTFLGTRGFSIAIPFVTGSLVIGAVVAAFARRSHISSSGYRIAAASGIAGPLIVTVAHLVAGPSRLDNAESLAVMLVGPYAAIAGLLGSLIVCAVPKAGGQIDDRPDQRTEPPRTDGLTESAPGWTVPTPASAYDDANDGTTTDLAAAPVRPKRPTRREKQAAKDSERAAKQEAAKRAEWEPQEGDDTPNPDVDWVQELKAVDMDDDAKEAPKPRRAKKTTARTRRKIDSGDAEA